MAATARTRVALLGGLLVFLASAVNVSGNMVFPVNHKFKGPGKHVSLGAWKEHDARRHRRLLAGADSAIDLQLGGNGHPSEAGCVIAFLHPQLIVSFSKFFLCCFNIKFH